MKIIEIPTYVRYPHKSQKVCLGSPGTAQNNLHSLSRNTQNTACLETRNLTAPCIMFPIPSAKQVPDPSPHCKHTKLQNDIHTVPKVSPKGSQSTRYDYQNCQKEQHSALRNSRCHLWVPKLFCPACNPSTSKYHWSRPRRWMSFQNKQKLRVDQGLAAGAKP